MLDENFNFKICSKCDTEQSIHNFRKCSALKGGYRYQCKKCDYEQNRKRYEEKRVEIILKSIEYNKRNKSKIDHKKNKQRVMSTKKGRLIRQSRKRVRNYLIKGCVDSVKIRKLIGCSTGFFRQHFEKQFDEQMNWENYGKTWVIDHIIPIASFDIENEQELRNANHWTNLRPFWKNKTTREQKRILNIPVYTENGMAV